MINLQVNKQVQQPIEKIKIEIAQGDTTLLNIQLIDKDFSPVSVTDIQKFNNELKFHTREPLDVEPGTVLYFNSNNATTNKSICFTVKEVDITNKFVTCDYYGLYPMAKGTITINGCCGKVYTHSRDLGLLYKPWDFSCCDSLYGIVRVATPTDILHPYVNVSVNLGNTYFIAPINDVIYQYSDRTGYIFRPGMYVDISSENEPFMITNVINHGKYAKCYLNNTLSCTSSNAKIKVSEKPNAVMNFVHKENKNLASKCGDIQIYLKPEDTHKMLPISTGVEYNFDIIAQQKTNFKKICDGVVCITPSITNVEQLLKQYS